MKICYKYDNLHKNLQTTINLLVIKIIELKELNNYFDFFILKLKIYKVTRTRKK
jgi:hypothetical protein